MNEIENKIKGGNSLTKNLNFQKNKNKRPQKFCHDKSLK